MLEFEKLKLTGSIENRAAEVLDPDKAYIQCQRCGYYEEVNVKLFARILGGAAIGLGGYALVTFLFAGTGLAFPLCVAIVAGGTALMAFSEQIADWLSSHYECPSCGSQNWKTLAGSEIDMSIHLTKKTHELYNIPLL